MATYVFNGYYGGDLVIAGGGNTLNVGSQFMLAPTWDVSSNLRSFTFTDDDANLSGDSNFLADESGNDSNQSVTVRDAQGNVIGSGKVYLETSVSFVAPDGTTITMYIVEVNGVVMGEITTAPLQPGVTYQVSATSDVSSGPTYASIGTTTYDPDLANAIQGGSLNDSIISGAGDDTVSGGAGNDTVYLGDGNDVFGDWGTEAGFDQVYGGAGNDQIIGGADNDQLWGEAGDDTLSGGAGDDNLSGGTGNDVFWISDDHNYDNIAGDADFDTVWFGNYTSTQGVFATFNGTASGSYDFLGTTGNGVFNTIEAIGGTDYADTLNASLDAGGVDLYGGGGNDSLTGGSGDDWLEGGTGNDTLVGSAGWDELQGGAGADYMSGGADGDLFWVDNTSGLGDTIIGGETGTGNDTLSLSSTSPGIGASVTLTGNEAGSYSYSGATGSFSQIEEIWLTQGNDTLNASATTTGGTFSGGDGNDSILGGSGADTLSGDAGEDTLSGGLGSDSLFGGAGADLVLGGAGNDTVYGGDGDDTLIGGAGNDTISTGAGADVIGLANGSGADLVTDFNLTLVDGLTVDQFDVSDLLDATGNPVNAWQVDVAEDGAGNAVLYFPGGETVTLQGVSTAAISSVPALHAMGIPCFAAGTLIGTPQGPRPVEALQRGDLVETLDAGAQPVLWASRREPGPGELRHRAALRPIEIRVGALGNDRPLRVSAQHALWVPEGAAGAMARAGHLAQADGRLARHMLGCRRVVWHHLLLPRHALIRAEGAWAESLWPGSMAMAALSPADRLALLALMPHLAPGLLGLAPVEAAYGPLARPMLLRRAVTPAAFSRWSLLLRRVSLLTG